MFGKLKFDPKMLGMVSSIMTDPNQLKEHLPLLNNAIGRLIESYKAHMAMQNSTAQERCVVMLDWRNGECCIIPVLVDSDGRTMEAKAIYTLTSLLEPCDIRGITAVIGQLSDPHAPLLAWPQILQMLSMQPDNIVPDADDWTFNNPSDPTAQPELVATLEEHLLDEIALGEPPLTAELIEEWDKVVQPFLFQEYASSNYATLTKLIANHVLRTDVAKNIVDGYQNGGDWTAAQHEQLCNQIWFGDEELINHLVLTGQAVGEALDNQRGT